MSSKTVTITIPDAILKQVQHKAIDLELRPEELIVNLVTQAVISWTTPSRVETPVSVPTRVQTKEMVRRKLTTRQLAKIKHFLNENDDCRVEGGFLLHPKSKTNTVDGFCAGVPNGSRKRVRGRPRKVKKAEPAIVVQPKPLPQTVRSTKVRTVKRSEMIQILIGLMGDRVMHYKEVFSEVRGIALPNSADPEQMTRSIMADNQKIFIRVGMGTYHVASHLVVTKMEPPETPPESSPAAAASPEDTSRYDAAMVESHSDLDGESTESSSLRREAAIDGTIVTELDEGIKLS